MVGERIFVRGAVCLGLMFQTAITAQTIDFSTCGPLCAPVKLASDPAGYQSIFIGSFAGAGADLVTPLKTMYTCIGYRSCGGEGAGMAPGAVNSENVFIGWVSGSHITTGTYNTAAGVGTMRAETTGTGNVALGVDAMSGSSGSNYSIGIGPNALGLIPAQRTIAIGNAAGHGGGGSSGAIADSVIIGVGALGGSGVATVSDLILLGSNILPASSVTGPNNVIALGRNVLSGPAVTSPAQDILIGSSILGSASVASPIQNVVIGQGAMNASSAVSPSYNTVIGYNAASTAYGNGNTVLGYNAATHVTSGGSNTIIGIGVATTTLTTGYNNILIGTNAGTDTVSSATSNQINIGNAFIGYNVAPAAASGYGSSPTVTGSGTAAFKVTVGSGGGATSATISMGTAPNGWVCTAQDETTAITSRQSADTTTSVTMTWSAAPAAADKIVYQCGAF